MEPVVLQKLLKEMDRIVDDEPMRPFEMTSSRRLKLIVPTKDVK